MTVIFYKKKTGKEEERRKNERGSETRNNEKLILKKSQKWKNNEIKLLIFATLDSLCYYHLVQNTKNSMNCERYYRKRKAVY